MSDESSADDRLHPTAGTWVAVAVWVLVLVIVWGIGLVVLTDLGPDDREFWATVGGAYLGGFVFAAIGIAVYSLGAEQKGVGRLVMVALALVPLQWIYLQVQDDVGSDGFAQFSMLFITVGAVATLLGLTEFWRYWVPAAHRETRSPVLIVADTTVMLLVLTISFGGLASVFEAHEVVRVEPAVGEDPVWSMEVFFAWQFWDSIPELEVPATLSWDAPFKTTNAGGGLFILLYKVLVILPVLAALTDLWRQRRQPADRIGAQGSAAS